MDNNRTGTLLQRRRKSVKIGKEETLLILRAYLNHPTSLPDILDEIKGNLETLLPAARELYTTGNLRQLRDRMSGKISLLLKKQTEDILDADIRSAVEDIRKLERRHIPDQEPAQVPANVPQEEPGPAHPQQDARAKMAADLPTDGSEEEERPERRRRRRKRPLADLVRENQEAYNKFITKKVPKLMQILGVSSSSEDN